MLGGHHRAGAGMRGLGRKSRRSRGSGQRLAQFGKLGERFPIGAAFGPRERPGIGAALGNPLLHGLQADGAVFLLIAS